MQTQRCAMHAFPRFFAWYARRGQANIVSGGMAAKAVAEQAYKMKRAHMEAPAASLTHQARRMLLSASLLTGAPVDSREVAQLLDAATYFGLGNDCTIVREGVEWCKTHDREIETEVMGAIVLSCATLKGDTLADEVISLLGIRSMRNARYLDARSITTLIAAFSAAGVFKDKLALYLSRRFVTLGKIGEFNCRQMVRIVTGLSMARYHNYDIRKTIGRRITFLREQFQVNDLVALVVGIAKMRIKEERIIKKIAGKSVELAEEMTATHVCTLFQAFSMFGVKYDQLFGVLTNRAVELMDEFSAKHISLTLASFQRISISNPELFDNLAERSMAVMAEHDSNDITHIFGALVHFEITDEELLKQLAEQSVAVCDGFAPKQLVKCIYSIGKLNFQHHGFMEALGKRVLYSANIMHAAQLREVLWALAKLNYRENEKLIRVLMNKAHALHFEFFRNTDGAEEIEDIFDTFGRDVCPELYDMYLTRDAEAQRSASDS
ncbi:hypothetical protein XU18_3442 [Perkinsela sp. CCAP 1560/4]|nr:hypothetical protein XU18_3442 [Perkinsela sp. CCAP 1560/4]|eukprot:KNH05471.1 hypothetical protein XU18_3442 [Perkinsela sp. CCAP 1560/4]